MVNYNLPFLKQEIKSDKNVKKKSKLTVTQKCKLKLKDTIWGFLKMRLAKFGIGAKGKAFPSTSEV